MPCYQNKYLLPPNLQPEGVRDLCTGLDSNTTLIKLVLAWNGLEDEGVVRGEPSAPVSVSGFIRLGSRANISMATGQPTSSPVP